MSKSVVAWTIAVVIVLLVLWWVIAGFGGDEGAIVTIDDNGGLVDDSGGDVGVDGDNDDGGSDGDDAGAPQTYTIEISSAGFSPSSLTINVRDIVVFVAVDGSNRWPASAVHPTHIVYPEGGGCIGSAFDSCEGIANGDSWPFTFNEVGSWGYHDHLSPGKTGLITVVG